ncbi:type I-E CRISPR-associated protein Cas5/CasD [Acidithiobacillus sulfuriphilus]|uniref:Type I-E CRISPR-associated protein Cas5/CasD n=2 Tax=Acidithiobacillus sulfuriphilus TaxID=1867749 RepID=A0A3M8QUG3_9PROT|nr:type I-E CRISPR-associated protein Cas5/CasD [Acidithiobacillus sulfuriphilus]RNF59321.1 type I-E CRISPR-associated protein Cas5/CasD [Acidithiobacillus sulfuriphilus]
MRDYLVFQLYGPLAAWGDIAVGETRPSALTPTKSAILGLVAAALGLRRPDTADNESDRQAWEDAHAALADGYGLAVKVEYPGLPLSDYHTAQVPSSGKGKNRMVFPTRRDELTRVARHDLNTILSRREYRQDAFCAVALWARVGAPHELNALRDGLLAPVFPLYLGRKSCPLALPLAPRGLRAPNVETALAGVSLAAMADSLEGFWKEWRPHAWLREVHPVMLWDIDAQTALDAQESHSRRDQPTSRRRWQFAVRTEHRAHLGGRP